MAKPGLDGHDRGAKIIARALRDGGFEVIYTGLHQTPEMIAEAALQEDVDAVGLSVLSGAHMTLFPEVIRLLKDKGAADVAVFGGGLHVAVTELESGVAAIRTRLAAQNIEIHKLEKIQPSLEDVFVALIEAEERKTA